jgi:hypothetical protein
VAAAAVNSGFTACLNLLEGLTSAASFRTAPGLIYPEKTLVVQADHHSWTIVRCGLDTSVQLGIRISHSNPVRQPDKQPANRGGKALANHLTPTELAREAGMDRREVISKCMEMGVPIFQGRIDKTLFLASLRESQGQPQVAKA